MRFENIKSSYLRYRKHTKEYKNYHTYNKVVQGFCKFIIEKVLDNYDVDLSGGDSLGTLAVRGKHETPSISSNGNIMGLSPNWRKTAQFKKDTGRDDIIFNTNEHTGGIRYKLIWHNKQTLTRNKIYYSFVFPESAIEEFTKRIMAGAEYTVKVKKYKHV